MKVNKQSLTDQILLEEKELAELKLPTVSGNHGGPINKMPEDRSPDKKQPPITIDLITGRDYPQTIRLSDYFKQIRYIRIDPVPDPSFYSFDINFIVSDNYIFGSSMHGIAQYDLQGRFIKFIIKNEIYYESVSGSVVVTKEHIENTIRGSAPVFANDKLYYKYDNYPKGISCMMEYKEDANLFDQQFETNPEFKRDFIGLGKKVMDLEHKVNFFQTTEINPIGDGLVATGPLRKSPSESSHFLSVTSFFGDTVTSFTDHDPIVNFSKSNYRNVESGISYYYNNTFHKRQPFVDTIFQVVPPNRLIPKYKLDFGDFGIKTANEGLNPSFDLKDRFVFRDILETSNFLFITYTKDYACSNTAKTGSLKYTRLLYDKRTQKTIFVYTDAPPVFYGEHKRYSVPEMNVVNDLDSNPCFWPMAVSSSGKPFVWFNGKTLKEKWKGKDSGDFKNLNEDDLIIAIYE